MDEFEKHLGPYLDAGYIVSFFKEGAGYYAQLQIYKKGKTYSLMMKHPFSLSAIKESLELGFRKNGV